VTFSRSWGRRAPGKSTLLHILGLHDAAWRRRIHARGEAVHKLDKKKRFRAAEKTLASSPKLPPPRRSHRLRKPRRSALLFADTPKKDRESIVCGRRSIVFTSWPKRIFIPRSFRRPAAGLVGIPARSWPIPARSSPTNPPQSSFRSGPRDHGAVQELNQEDGVTIIQVTHSNENAFLRHDASSVSRRQ